MEHSYTGMPQQRSLRKRMMPAAGRYDNHSWQVSQVFLFLFAKARIKPSLKTVKILYGGLKK